MVQRSFSNRLSSLLLRLASGPLVKSPESRSPLLLASRSNERDCFCWPPPTGRTGSGSRQSSSKPFTAQAVPLPPPWKVGNVAFDLRERNCESPRSKLMPCLFRNADILEARAHRCQEMFVFFHGRMSSPLSPKLRILREFLSEFGVCSLNKEPWLAYVFLLLPFSFQIEITKLMFTLLESENEKALSDPKKPISDVPKL